MMNSKIYSQSCGLFLALLIFLISGSSQAESNPQLTEFIQSTIHSELVHGPKEAQSTVVTTDDFFLRRILLRIQAIVGIDVPWIATFQILPEVEMVWQRPYAEGVSDYKPFAKTP
jgi:hypothetical protein